MRAKLIESNKPEHYIHPVRNVDTSAAAAQIPVGSPLILNLSNTPQPPTYTNGLQPGWEDGLQIVLPNTAGAANCAEFFYGFATAPILVQQLGESMLHGVGKAAVFRASRAATTANWPAVASSAGFGQVLICDTTNNCFNVVGTGTVTTPACTLLDDFPALASSASNATDTRTVLTSLLRAFIRQM